MRKLTYSMSASVDGYIVGPDGGFDWSVPDEEVFRAHIEETRDVGVHVRGRRLCTRRCCTGRPLSRTPRSTTRARVDRAVEAAPEGGLLLVPVVRAGQRPPGHRRLGAGDRALRAESAEGDIAIGGAALASQAAALGLIGEYRVWIYPVLVGGGIPFFPHHERQVKLELIETRTFASKVLRLRYGVTR